MLCNIVLLLQSNNWYIESFSIFQTNDEIFQENMVDKINNDQAKSHPSFLLWNKWKTNLACDAISISHVNISFPSLFQSAWTKWNWSINSIRINLIHEIIHFLIVRFNFNWLWRIFDTIYSEKSRNTLDFNTVNDSELTWSEFERASLYIHRKIFQVHRASCLYCESETRNL